MADSADPDISVRPIGVVRSPYRERFGIPRQAGLVEAAHSVIELLPPWDTAEAVRGLESFSHIWVLSYLHARKSTPCQAMVRPPRLGGNVRVGVFASRSPFRPNPIGLSAVRLLAVEQPGSGVVLRVSGLDLLDGTPVLDIKPYVSYADSIADAQCGFAPNPPEAALEVRWTREALDGLASACGGIESGARIRGLIDQMLALDPRPAYDAESRPGRRYSMVAGCVDATWFVEGTVATVVSVRPA